MCEAGARMLRRVFIGVLGLAGLILLIWQGLLYRHHLHFVPDDFGVWRIRYVEEQAWGFGPGGNETGIIVYDMPQAVQTGLQAEGIGWLRRNVHHRPDSRARRYDDWQATPVPPSLPWADPGRCGEPGSDSGETLRQAPCPGISGYLDRYGFLIEVDPVTLAWLDAALFAPGAYYAEGRVGLLILVPARGRIVFVYSG